MKNVKLEKGIFVVVDGVDGSGKTTITKLLAEWFRLRGYDVLLTHEPSELEIGKQIEEIVHTKQEKEIASEKLVELFTADRAEHIAKIIKPALDAGKIVLCDRYYYSTLAYNLELEEWPNYLGKINVLQPDLTLIFDLPVETAMARLQIKYTQGDDTKTIFERKEKLQNVREKFLAMPKNLSGNIKLIDASKSVEEVFEACKTEVEKVLKNAKKQAKENEEEKV